MCAGLWCGYVIYSLKGLRPGAEKWARSMFLATLIYIPCSLARWREQFKSVAVHLAMTDLEDSLLKWPVRLIPDWRYGDSPDAGQPGGA